MMDKASWRLLQDLYDAVESELHLRSLPSGDDGIEQTMLEMRKLLEAAEKWWLKGRRRTYTAAALFSIAVEGFMLFLALEKEAESAASKSGDSSKEEDGRREEGCGGEDGDEYNDADDEDGETEQ